MNSTSRTSEGSIAFWEGGATLEDWDRIQWVVVPPHTHLENIGTEKASLPDRTVKLDLMNINKIYLQNEKNIRSFYNGYKNIFFFKQMYLYKNVFP